MKIFPESLRKLWDLWEIRVTVVLSLFLQGILILFGSRRKYSTSKWLKLLWLAYLSADWVATVSLSVLSSRDNENATPDDANEIITAFWAPFLLLHLGGPDTITAYSLEDNELWWRHLLVLLVQVALACYALLRSWTGHALNFLSIPMFVAGVLKFGERTWAFRSASSKQFRESMFRKPDPGPNYARFMDDFRSKRDEGFEVELGRVIEAPTGGDFSLAISAPSTFPKAAHLQHTDVFFPIFKRLFADLIISIHDILNSQSFFQNRSWDEAFKVIEVELAFMYDLLYTKAALVYSVKAAICRCISFVAIVSVSVTFLLLEKQDYARANVAITYVLMAGAIILEMYAVILSLCSEWTMLWLVVSEYKNAVDLLFPVMSSVSSAENRRWSNVITRYNFIAYCLEKPAEFNFLQKMMWICKQFFKKDADPVSPELKEMIFQRLMMASTRATNFESCKKLCAHRGDWVLENEKCSDKFRWSVEEEFDHSILLWHIATDLCYHSDLHKHSDSFTNQNCEASKSLSEYMLYLLVKCPSMLPNGIGKIRLQDTRAEATQFFKQKKCKRDHGLACKDLLDVSTEIPPADIKGDRSNSLLFDACRLAKDLQSLESEGNWENQKKWELMSHVWVEMLSYAACKCRWNPHARQLRRGGELLTHVWFLMAHLGITEQRQKGHVITMFKVY